LKEEVLVVRQYSSSGRNRMWRRETVRENDALIRLSHAYWGTRAFASPLLRMLKIIGANCKKYLNTSPFVDIDYYKTH
jgi:hypothetical protein